jgi:proton-coupled amino acid transporter
MTVVAITYAVVPSLCVLAFGAVTNGSVTAFLLQAFHDDDSMTAWLMIANTAVSISVLLTYPLQLFPALEVIGPSMAKKFKCCQRDRRRCSFGRSKFRNQHVSQNDHAG